MSRTLFDSERTTPRQHWLFCRFDQVPVFALGLDINLAIRLWACGFRAVASLDELIGDYREQELFDLIGKKQGREVIARLMEYCRRSLLGVKGQHHDPA